MNKTFFCKAFALMAVTVVAGVNSASAKVKLDILFQDHMILQRDRATPIWGTATPGEQVTVRFAGQTKQTQAEADGRWQVKLEAMPASAEGRILTAGTQSCKDVLVGDIWLCSGQSNMAMAVRECDDAEQEIAAAKYPGIRYFPVAGAPSAKPLGSVKGGAWTVCSPESVATYSAVGYYFGRELHRKLNVPIGLVASCVPATRVEAWMRLAALETLPELGKIAHEQLAQWQAQVGASQRERPPIKPIGAAGVSSSLYNGMIAPLMPFAIKGAIWYQGESNAGHPGYQEALTLMIKDWRAMWGQGDFPFIIQQLVNYNPAATDPNVCGGWPLLREAQSRVAERVPNVGISVAIELGNAVNGHPKNKQELGRRLALVALDKSYAQPCESSGPRYASLTIEDGSMRVSFTHAKGMYAKGGPLKGFAVASADKKFAWAEARIEGETVMLSCAGVQHPVAVRYAWADNPEGCNLFNAAGLPAHPFRAE